ncbi:TPA: incFII family plasmid replication initiator RepA [Klebsiella pneumoniae]|uniref:plasmid replication initiator RepA n=1 Tax=Klebsiella pneumoniae TaxID=573 RepID=UPI0024A897E7|nr:plasmid replication initiator RepA [Klebsiella pneumoniae]HDO7154516.1 incFII family plasmid replication initiator RepA [Klebsiella pneumoniae]
MTEQNITYYRQVKNPFPKFIVPKKKGSDEEKATLPFNKKLMAKAAGLTERFAFALFVAFARSQGKRFRMPPPLRLRALEALIQAICYHYDPLLNRVNASLTTIAIECGLATETKKSGVSITRATRALRSLAEDFGLVTYSMKNFDAEIGCYMPTDITFTSAFFEALDISPEAVAAARTSRAEWKNKQRERRGQSRLDIGELISQGWSKFHTRFKENRLKRKAEGEERARAKRDAERSRKEVELSVRAQVNREIRQGKHVSLTFSGVKELIEERVMIRMVKSRRYTTRLSPA